MRQLSSLTIFSLLMGVLCAGSATAADVEADESAAKKGAKVELAVRVTAGKPPKPIGNAEVSIKGSDGSDLQPPRRTDKKGEVRFPDLPIGDIMIVIIAKEWTTYKATRKLSKQQEVVPVTLQPLD